jgi:TolC family type I secretion outer membrane protein
MQIRLAISAILLLLAAPLRAEVPVAMPPPDLGGPQHDKVLEHVLRGTLPRSLDLPTALALARACNPQVALADERAREQAEHFDEVRAGRGPQLSLDGMATATDEGLIENFGPEMESATENWNGGLQVRQPLYQGGAQDARERGQRLRGDAAREDVRTVRYDVMFATAQSFFGALLARDLIGAQEEALRLHQEQLAVASNRFVAGVGPQFDVLQADVAARNARPPLLRARNQYRLAVEELRRAIGLPFPEGVAAGDLELAGGWPYPRIEFSLAEAFAAAQQHRPELAALTLQRQAATYDARAARGERRPQLAATAGYGWRSKTFGDGLGDTLEGWDVGLQASIPLFSSGLYRSRERQAESRVRQAELQREVLLQAVEVDVSRAYADWQVSLEILTTADGVIQQAEEAVRLARNRFNAGAIPQVDVLQAALGLTRARLDKAQASHDYNLAVARLNRAMGLFSVGERIELGAR